MQRVCNSCGTWGLLRVGASLKGDGADGGQRVALLLSYLYSYNNKVIYNDIIISRCYYTTLMHTQSSRQSGASLEGDGADGGQCVAFLHIKIIYNYKILAYTTLTAGGGLTGGRRCGGRAWRRGPGPAPPPPRRPPRWT